MDINIRDISFDIDEGPGDSLHLNSGAIHEPHIVDFIYQTLKSTDCFIDVGAHIGYFSLLASKLCKEVYAIEPSPKAFAYLERNISSNSSKNIMTLQGAITDTDDKIIKLYEQEEGWGQNSLSEKLVDRGEYKVINVTGWTLDSFITNPHTDLILKSDTQGNEVKVLRSFKKGFATGLVKGMALELWPAGLEAMGCTVKELYDLIGPNYKIHTHVIMPGNRYYLIDCPYEVAMNIYGNKPGQREHGDLLCTRNN